jgi:small subunit ribosomal protein S20
MANHLSALKRARQTEKPHHAQPRKHLQPAYAVARLCAKAIEKGDKAAAEQLYRTTVSVLDKAIQKGTLHENTASRYKSRLSKSASLR